MHAATSLSVPLTHRHDVPLLPTAPFALEHSLSFLCSFPPTRGEQVVERRSLTKALSIDGEAAVISVREVDGHLRCAVTTRRPLAPSALGRLISRVRFQLSLDDDLAPLRARAEGDPAFAPVERRWHGHHHVKFPSPFEIAVWAVLAQRNQRLGRRIKDALVAALGPRVEVDGVEHRAFPEPDAVLDGSRVRTIVGDDARADAIVTVARAFRELDVERTLLAPRYEEAERFLRELPRIGPWSAAFILFRGLGRMERLAASSDPILDAARRVYGRRTERELRAIAEGYGPWCGYWALYLRRS